MMARGPSCKAQKPLGSELTENKGDEPVVDLVKTVRGRNNIPQSFFCECEDVPKGLWDTRDKEWLNKVHCHAEVRLTHVDQNQGTFAGTVRFKFLVRTPKGGEALVPDVRMPALTTTSLERNRSFKQAEGEHSTLWTGVSSYSFSGFEIFEVRDFPYDRQLVNLGLLHFIWRSGDDHEDFNGMEVVFVDVKTVSVMPEWDVFRGCLEVKNSKRERDGPTRASRFELRLRLQRQPTYYIVNIFAVTVGITVMSMCGLLVDPELLAERLSLYAAGLLTLIAFKYSINQSLPNVSYLTLVDKVLLAEMFTHILLSAEAAAASVLLVRDIPPKNRFVVAEFIMGGVLLLLWLAILVHVSWGRGRTDWEKIWTSQEGDAQELED